MEVNYSVTIEKFAEKYFIKNFQKKYKSAWIPTEKALVAQFEHIDKFLELDKAEIISHSRDTRIVKTEFKIAGSKESAKTSGHRCIIAVNEKDKKVSVLLVYTKTDVIMQNETVWWKKIVCEEFPQYSFVLN